MSTVAGPVPVYDPVRAPLPDAGQRPARRWRVFAGVFLAVAAIALAANWLRPAIYRSAATLLVEAPAQAGEMAAPIGLAEGTRSGAVVLATPTRGAQLLATEQQRLLATPLLQAVAEEFASELVSLEKAADPFAALQAMARVKFDASTNLLDVGLEGRTPELLKRVLERWLARYEESRAALTAQTRDTDDRAAREQLAALDAKIAARRAEIDAFRAAHGIVSEERTENTHASKLKGLNESINKAEDEEMRAAARLDALRAAAAAGKPVAEAQNLAAIERLQEKVETLRDMVRAQRDQFTEKYAQIAPEIVAARKDLAQAEQDLATMRERAQTEVMTKAEQELATARDAKLALMRQQSALKGELNDFSRRFEELGALRTRLAELETQAAPLRERLVKSEVAAADLAPRVSVLAAPSLPMQAISPAYARDALLGVGVAFVAALLVTWLVEFLTRGSPASGAPPQPHIYSLNTQLFPPPGGGLALPGGGVVDAPHPVALPSPPPRTRELSPEEVAALLATGDERARLVVALLVSGVGAGEIAGLRGGDLDAAGRLALDGRGLSLAPGVRALWQRVATGAEAPLFAAAPGTALTLADLEGTLVYVAHDAGLAHPEEVTAVALRHTCFAWLVRHGLKLGELPRVGGALAPAQIASYAPLAPPGAGRTLDQIDPWYPALAALA
ncbi:MAG TPA: hypothetical protein PJ986_15055 [Gammaproteobacteria bacterium]|nr:hypothetical protein [Gammaproteobacteria bacterium]